MVGLCFEAVELKRAQYGVCGIETGINVKAKTAFALIGLFVGRKAVDISFRLADIFNQDDVVGEVMAEIQGR